MRLANRKNEADRWGTAAATAAIGVLFLVGVGHAGTPIDENVDAASDGLVTVENISGSVVVVGWDRNEVEVKGSLGEDVKELIVERDGDRVTIEVELPRRINRNVEETDLEIKVPQGSSLDIETISASVEVKAVVGELELESVSGRITVNADAKMVTAATVSERIEIVGQIAEVSAESVSGQIVLEGTEGEAEAATTSGAIEIVGGNFARVSCASVSGKIVFAGTPAKDGEFDFENLSGSVILELPSNLSAEVEVESFSGKIDSDFGGEVHRPKHGPGASLHAVYGNGDADLSIETFSGRVDIRKK